MSEVPLNLHVQSEAAKTPGVERVSEWEQTPGLHCRSPDSGEFWYISRELKGAI